MRSIRFIPEPVKVKRRVMNSLARHFGPKDGLLEAERPLRRPKHEGVWLDRKSFWCRGTARTVYRQPNGRFASRAEYLTSQEAFKEKLKKERWFDAPR